MVILLCEITILPTVEILNVLQATRIAYKLNNGSQKIRNVNNRTVLKMNKMFGHLKRKI